jgi:hypothetical protein
MSESTSKVALKRKILVMGSRSVGEFHLQISRSAFEWPWHRGARKSILLWIGVVGDGMRRWWVVLDELDAGGRGKVGPTQYRSGSQIQPGPHTKPRDEQHPPPTLTKHEIRSTRSRRSNQHGSPRKHVIIGQRLTSHTLSRLLHCHFPQANHP